MLASSPLSLRYSVNITSRPSRTSNRHTTGQVEELVGEHRRRRPVRPHPTAASVHFSHGHQHRHLDTACQVHLEDKQQSYDEQFRALIGATDHDVLRSALPKPSREAQTKAPGAKHVPFTDGIYVTPPKRPLLAIEPKTISREEADWRMKQNHYKRSFLLIACHLALALLCVYYFSWSNLAIGTFVFALPSTCIGIMMSYHRQLAHRSFKTHKWLEYTAAWVGVHAGQAGPIEWVSNHRAHHLHTDTPLDIHSPYEGFWWAHMGWLVDMKASVERPYLDRSNVQDLVSQPFYRFLEATWFEQLMIRLLLTQVFFGPEAVCWTFIFPIVYSWHASFFTNSACHLWGYQTYESGDLSTNNWGFGLLSGGEGWHNNHHAFPWSAALGLQWWEFDATYLIIRLLEMLGLAWDVQLPTAAQKAAKRKQRFTAKAL